MRPSKEAKALVDGLIERHGYQGECWGWGWSLNVESADGGWTCRVCGQLCSGARSAKMADRGTGSVEMTDLCFRCRFLEHLPWCPTAGTLHAAG